MALQKEIIKSVVSRCRMSSIRETLGRWGRLSREQLSDNILHGTKRQIAERILQLVEKADLNDEIAGDLELAYMQLHSRSKLWTVYKLTGHDLHLNLDPRTLRSRIVHNLYLKWKDGRVFGNMRLFGGAIWLRVHLGSSPSSSASRTSRPYNHNNSVFIVTFPGSPYVLISRTGIRLNRAVTEAVTETLNAESLKNIQLSGRHVSSLADIALNKDNAILSHKYRDKEVMENPLLHKEERKRKAVDEDWSDTEELVDENRMEKRSRKEEVEKLLGCEPQPVLETLEYKFKLRFHGKPVSDIECKSSVEIKGPSVLDGMCQLARAGLVKFPLPKHLTTVTSSARNNFTVESRKK